MKQLKCASLLFVFIVHSILGNTQTIATNLKCNFWKTPSGIDEANPNLGWTINVPGGKRGMHQTAYQILVASSQNMLRDNKSDLWNSGKVHSDNMTEIRYAGKPLSSSRKYWWKVRVWNENNNASSWSKPSYWVMGILNKNHWNAQWISAKGAEKYAPVIDPIKTDFIVHRRNLADWLNKMPKPGEPNFSSMLLRKEFQSKSRLQQAVVHICGLGNYELAINGKKAGNYLLTPGWSSYDKTVLYDTYDVTALIKQGRNVIGIILSNGMYNIQPDTVRYVKMLNTYGQLKAIACLRLEYTDGTIKTIGTDNTWRVAPGPVTYMNLYGGEDYDARLEPTGWNQPSFKAGSTWSNAIEINNPVDLKGLSCAAPSIAAIAKLPPVKITKLKPNLWVYDLGQNTSVMPEIVVKGKKGSYVRILPSELLSSDGTIDRSSATQDGVRPAWWQYTIATNNVEKWFPKFFYQGSRYLQVELFPAPGDTVLPIVQSLNGVVVHSSADSVGQFQCSNELFNRIYKLVRWAQRSNMMSVLTDCPQREKMPWLEQYHLNGPSLRYNYDLATFYTKAMNDMADAQLENGLVPNIAPEFFHAGSDWENNGFRNSPEWGSSFIIVPWQQYLFTGDTKLIRVYYDKMKHYLSFLDAMSKDNILPIGLGDWYDIGPKPAWGSQLTPREFTATAIYYYDYDVMSKMAEILGKKDDAKSFKQKASLIHEAFNKTFYNVEKGIYATGSNTTCAMPLFFNLVETQNRSHLLSALVDSIKNRNNSFTSGEVGYRFLLRTLADEDRSDVVYDMNNQSDRPGYGYQLKKGATSLTEKWDAGVGSFGSQNHFMSGQINEWFFHDLIGISVDEKGAGFRKSIIKPAVVGDLTWVKGSYQSVSGFISSEWKRNNDTFTLTVSIPANTSATVYIPAKKESEVTESGRIASKVKGIKFIKMQNDMAVYEIDSGDYHFVSKTNL